MTRSNKLPLTVKLADGKAVKARIRASTVVRPQHRLDDMNDEELRRELDALPRRIDEARAYRDKLFRALKERWSTAYSNDQEFVTAYARAEAAGAEVVSLLDRAAKAGRIWYERHSGRLV